MNWKHYLPNKITDFKVSHSPELLEGATALYDYCELHNKWEETHYYRKHIIKHGLNVGETLDDDIHSIIVNKILKPINAEGYCESIKLEQILAPNPEHTFQYKKISRFANIPPAENIDTDKHIYHSSGWHVDKGAPANNMVMLLYLNDVDESKGPFTIAYPPTVVTNQPTESYRDTASIPSVSILGQAGTLVCFHSYLLHRGNIPLLGERKAILLSMLPEDDKYKVLLDDMI